MKKALLAIGLACGAASSANATVIYEESFNDYSLFEGGFIESTSNDRYEGGVDLYRANSADGWSFSGDTEYAYHASNGDGALSLNEQFAGGQATFTLAGLTAGNLYSLSFDYFGDNRPGEGWALAYSIDGDPETDLLGVDHEGGGFSGWTETSSFVASGTTATFWFADRTAGGEGSPVIDNVIVSDSASTVPEPATWSLMILGFGAVGYAMRRRIKAKVSFG